MESAPADRTTCTKSWSLWMGPVMQSLTRKAFTLMTMHSHGSQWTSCNLWPFKFNEIWYMQSHMSCCFNYISSLTLNHNPKRGNDISILDMRG